MSTLITTTAQIGTIKDAGGNNTAMTIDSTGRVLMPQVPMFQVHASGNSYVSANQTIAFDTEEIDVGNNFNTSNYTFTAPVNGYYHMHAHVYVDVDSGTDANVHYKLNGSDYNGINIGAAIYSYAYNNAGGAAHEPLDLPLIMKLAAGDEVKVDVITAGTAAYYAGSRETWWFGYLIGTY